MSQEKEGLLKCIECGVEFFTEGEEKFYKSKGLNMPKRCKKCRTKKKLKYERRQRQKEEYEYLSKLSFKQVDKKELSSFGADTSLFIIGNGFDLMHGVPSSYYNFRDSMGKNNRVRFTLETFVHVDDVWGDFESSLAYLDRESMLGVADMWFEDFEVLDEDDDDFSAADYFAAQEAATTPIYVLMEELPKRFRQWIESLKYNGRTKPLCGLINKESRYINFNYTEFLESIYGVDKENVLYIHGDRRDKKCQLVLGHEQAQGRKSLPLAKVPGTTRLLSKLANEINKGLTGRNTCGVLFIWHKIKIWCLIIDSKICIVFYIE